MRISEDELQRAEEYVFANYPSVSTPEFRRWALIHDMILVCSGKHANSAPCRGRIDEQIEALARHYEGWDAAKEAVI